MEAATPEPAPPARSAPASPTGAARSPPAPARTDLAPVVLDVRDLHTYFYTYDGVVRAIDGVSFQLRRGETLGLVGETGCGKSVTAFSITRLVAEPPGRIVSGKALFRGANLLWGVDREATYAPIRGTNRIRVRRKFRRIKTDLQRMNAVRGRGVAMIFQEPSQAMNPVFSISDQIGEVLYTHKGVETVDTLLFAGKLDPSLEPALSAFLAAGRDHEPEATRKAAEALAEAVQLPSLASKLIEKFGAEPPSGKEPLAALERWLQEARVDEGVAALVRATEAGDSRGARAAAAGVARLLGVPSLEPELFHSARVPRGRSGSGAAALRRLVRRTGLTRLQRGYLRRERRRVDLDRQLRRVFFEEMRYEKRLGTERRRIRAAQARNAVARLPYRLWGIRGRARAPLRHEMFWQAVQRLESVQIANPVTVARGYPHELSGGMLQRVMIAVALSTDPEVLIADEPTTALDVTIQAQILELMRELKVRVGTAIVLITHDLAVIAEVADRVCVMYAGQVVESAPVRGLFASPRHPYTQGLLASIPRLDRPEKQLRSIPGSVPDLIDPPTGCRFHPRCPHAMPICAEKRPPVTVEGDQHTVACWLYHGPPVAT